MNKPGLFLLSTLALCPPAGALAQDPTLEADTRIRVRALDVGQAASPGEVRSFRLTGYLDRLSADSLWLRVESTDGPLLSVPRSSIQELEISSGRKRNPGRGALWGAGIGLGLGVLAAVSVDDCAIGTDDDFWDFCPGDEAVIILGSVATGAAWGALIGLLITSERWVTVPHTSLTFRGEGGGISLGISVRIGP